MRVATNPYHIDGPLGPDDPFADRDAIFAWVRERLQAGDRLLALYGLPKMGKTSFLQQLSRRLNSGYLSILTDIPFSGDWAADNLSLHMRQSILSALQSRGDYSTLADSTGISQDLTALPDLIAAADAKPLLMIDGLSLYTTSDRNWRALLTCLSQLPGTPALLAIEGHPKQVTASPDSPLCSIPSMALENLTELETEELLLQAARGSLRYDYDAVQRIHLWTGGHPYLVQLFGYALFDFCGRTGRVNVHAVDKVVDRVLQMSHSLFEQMWSFLSPTAKIAMTALGERRGRHDLFTDWDVYHFLRWRRVQVSVEEVQGGLLELSRAGLLVELGKGSYQIPLALWKTWLKEKKPVNVVIRETRHFRRLAPPRKPVWRQRTIRWRSVLSWLTSLLLIFLIILLWRSRELAPQSISSGPNGLEARSSGLTTLSQRMILYAGRGSKKAPWKIYAMQPDGSDPQQLTDGESQDTYPVWAPDGKQILFVSDRQGNQDIWKMDAKGADMVNLTRHPADDRMPAWSPQGDAIAFTSYRDGNWEIYVMKPDGSEVTRLTDHPAADMSPSWSPDGQRIAFASYRDGNWEIYMMNRDGSQLRRLTTNNVTDFAPAWSPASDLIAFESYRDGDMEIYVISLSNLQSTNITREPASDDHGPAWSSDGRAILYYSNRDGGWDIFRVNLDGSGKVNLTQSEALEQKPAW